MKRGLDTAKVLQAAAAAPIQEQFQPQKAPAKTEKTQQKGEKNVGGRPQVNDPMCVRISVLFRESEVGELRKLAKRSGQQLSPFLRGLALAEINKQGDKND